MYDFDCAVCGNAVNEEDCGHCFTCGWDGDTVQENEPDYRGGANKISLNEARIKWAAGNTSNVHTLQPAYVAAQAV